MRRPRCSPKHLKHCSPAHADLVAGYRAARDSALAARESGGLVPSEFAYGAAVAYYQLEPSDLAAAAPVPTFKRWLIGHRRVVS